MNSFILNYDNHIILADDLELCKDYYINKLGLRLKFEFKDKGMIAFHVGNEEPAIIVKDKNVFPNSAACTWFEVEDVNTAYKSLAENGVDFLSAPYEIGTGLAAEFADPFGNIFGITDYSKFPH